MSTTKKVSLKKLAEFNTVWHEESALVFKSQKEIVVIGKLVNKEILPLTDVDISTCEKFKFKYEIPVASEEEEEVEEVEETTGEAEEAEGEAEGEVEAEEGEEETAVEEEVVVKEVVEESTKEVAKEVTKEVAKEVAKEVDDLLASEPDAEIDEFYKTINDLNRIWKTTNETNNSRIHALEIELEKTKREFGNLEDLYEKMKVKFDGIKQLFSL
jgi:hypothetical protein